jgi:hypothetical protein
MIDFKGLFCHSSDNYNVKDIQIMFTLAYMSVQIWNCEDSLVVYNSKKIYSSLPKYVYATVQNIQGGSNMTGTNCDLFTHNQSRSYLNHLVCKGLLVFACSEISLVNC